VRTLPTKVKKLTWWEMRRRQWLTQRCHGTTVHYKVVCNSNSLCFFPAHAPTHVSIDLWTFRCLVGHVFQRSGPVDRNMCGTIVNMSQVNTTKKAMSSGYILLKRLFYIKFQQDTVFSTQRHSQPCNASATCRTATTPSTKCYIRLISISLNRLFP
jgi:hypothetical protein